MPASMNAFADQHTLFGYNVLEGSGSMGEMTECGQTTFEFSQHFMATGTRRLAHWL